MKREEIKKYLPHREPMLLVDEMNLDGEYVLAKYHVRGDEYFLQGHYPGHPVVPGVILCEIMGQSCALLVKELLLNRTPMYAGLDGVKFKKPVVPGDTVNVKARIESSRKLMVVVNAEAFVNGEMCVKGKLTFVMVDNDKLRI
ncbi:MAG TPA: 3-hydroxyacyl-ACP dehydratase FabZ [Bacteroidaceae bacterium]|nr:3-hydroxyacyl-ACP dehydratase FabZ [Bacteroidaceae bacterium]